MRNLRRVCAAVLLASLFAIPAVAGEMSAPGITGEMSGPGVSGPMDTPFAQLLESVAATVMALA